MLNLADTPLLGTGEGPGFVAEQFTLDQVFGHRAAVDGNKVVGTAGAAFVNVPGQGILTGTGFTMQQHVCGNIQDRPDCHITACIAGESPKTRGPGLASCRNWAFRRRFSSARCRFSRACRSSSISSSWSKGFSMKS